MNPINSIQQFITAYNMGQRLFAGQDIDTLLDFSGMDISGATFSKCYLYADFSHANLADCKFIDCNIKTCDFSYANLTRAEIRGCAVEATVYKGAILTDFVFEDNSFYNSILSGEDFKLILADNGGKL